MRSAIVSGILLTCSIVLPAAQPELYRGPYRFPTGGPVRFVAPERGVPLTIEGAAYLRFPPPLTPAGGQRLDMTASVRSQSIRPIPVSGITLRIAIGPTRDGMVTFRMRPATDPSDSLEPPARLTREQGAVPLRFTLAQEDPLPPPIVMRQAPQIVATVERIEADEGQLIFENLHATELLWEALGRPTLSSR